MKKTICYILAGLLVLTSCSRDPRGRQNNGNITPPAEIAMTANLDVTISYTGRGYSVDESGTLVTDNFHFRCNSPVAYVVDAVQATEFRTSFGGNMGRFAYFSQERLSKELDSGEAQLSKVLRHGEQDFSTYRMDDGDVDWYIVAFAADEQGRYTGSYASILATTEEVKPVKTNQWQISRGARSFVQWNHEQIEVENFTITAASSCSYCYSIIDAAEFQRRYGTRVMDFFNAELNLISETLPQEEETFASVLMAGSDTAQPDRLWAGNYIFFCYGVDLYGFLTGEYSEYHFTVEEEAATPAFSRWLGEWKLTGIGNTYDSEGYPTGKKTITYNLTIESEENNVYFAVNGWEFGQDADPSVSRLVRNYWIGAPYDASDGSLLFIPSEMEEFTGTDGNRYVTTLLGDYEYEGKIDAAIGDYVIARATLTDDSHGTVRGLTTNLALDDEGKETAEVEFATMQYWDLRIDASTGNYLVDDNGYIMGPLELTTPFFTYNEFDHRGNLKTSTPMTLEKISGESDPGQNQEGRIQAPRSRRVLPHVNPSTKAVGNEEGALQGFSAAKRRQAVKSGRIPARATLSGPARTPATERPRKTVAR